MQPIVLINGKRHAKISVFDRAMQFGDGLFETLLVENSNILFWQHHFERLNLGCKRLKITPTNENIWLNDLKKALSKSNTKTAVIKLIYTRGESLRGYGFKKSAKPCRIIIVSALPKSNKTCRLSICENGYSANSLLQGIKHCNRLEQVLAKADIDTDDGIMLGPQNQVISTTNANIFIIKNGIISTPDLGDCGIEGTRYLLIKKLAEAMELACEVRKISLDEVFAADEVFITNSLIGVQKVAKIAEVVFKKNPITQQIQAEFAKLKLQEKSLTSIKKPISLLTKITVLLVFIVVIFWFISINTVSLRYDKIYHLKPNSTLNEVASELTEIGAINNKNYLIILAKIKNLSKSLQSGHYRIKSDSTLNSLLNDFASGKVAEGQVSLIEGKTIKEYFSQLSLRKDLYNASLNLNQTMNFAEVKTPFEGRLWADTYRFNYGDTVVSLFSRARQIMDNKLAKLWQNRQANLPLKTPYEAIILASLIEKETAHNAEKSKIAGVFISRLKRKMLLQTDPSIIYALGEKYQKPLKKSDLAIDSPHNTYKYKGLPPTAISSVSYSSLFAALNPELGDDIYFVSKKDGSHAFAATYDEHLDNIKKYLK